MKFLFCVCFLPILSSDAHGGAGICLNSSAQGTKNDGHSRTPSGGSVGICLTILTAHKTNNYLIFILLFFWDFIKIGQNKKRNNWDKTIQKEIIGDKHNSKTKK